MIQAAYQQSDPTVFDSDEVLDADGLPDGYTEYLPGETQIVWRIVGFRPDSPYNSVMEFSDGVIPLLYVPLTPDTVAQFKSAMDQVFDAQNGVTPGVYDEYEDDGLAEGDGFDPDALDDEDSERDRLQPWKVRSRVSLGALSATIREPSNRSSWVFAGLMLGSLVVLGACTVVSAIV